MPETWASNGIRLRGAATVRARDIRVTGFRPRGIEPPDCVASILSDDMGGIANAILHAGSLLAGEQQPGEDGAGVDMTECKPEADQRAR